VPHQQAVHAIECMNAKKHVLIEKPMALSKEDADDIEAAVRCVVLASETGGTKLNALIQRVKNGVVTFVGYMRRYATAYLRIKEMLKNAKQIQYGEQCTYLDFCSHTTT
jgi:predicted dehydrogenase